MAQVEPLWDFSLKVYGRPGVAKALIALQDRVGANVNILLMFCWAARYGRVADPQAVVDRRAAWQTEVVQPLRRARRALSESADDPERRALRRRIAAVELEAERQELLALEEMVVMDDRRAGDDRPKAAARSLTDYFDVLGADLDSDARDCLFTLMKGAFPKHAPNDLQAALAGAFATRLDDERDGGKAHGVVADS